jgi:hypothetical protein
MKAEHMAELSTCFFQASLLPLKTSFGDGVPLITARAGLMTPTGSNARWVLPREARRRFFYRIASAAYLDASIPELIAFNSTSGFDKITI